MSLSEISCFEDITALNIRPNRGGKNIGPPFFTSIKEDSDTQVRGHCSVAEVIHNLYYCVSQKSVTNLPKYCSHLFIVSVKKG